MLLEDLLPLQPASLYAVAPPPSLPEDPPRSSMPANARSSADYPGLPPPTVQCEPPPVTRLIPENMISSLPGMAGHAVPMAGASLGVPLAQITATGTMNYGPQPAINAKSLFCSETEPEEGAGNNIMSSGPARSHNDVLRNTLQENGSTSTTTSELPPRIVTSSTFEPCPLPSNYTNSNPSINNNYKNQSVIDHSNVNHGVVGMSRPPTRSTLPRTSGASMNTNGLAPITIKIPNTKVRLPHKKGGKQASYKPHGPGDGLLMVATTRHQGQGPHQIPHQQYPTTQRRQHQQQQQKQQQHHTNHPPPTAPNTAVDSLTSIQTGQGTFNVISTCEPGSKVPTPPDSHLDNASLSMTGLASTVVSTSVISTGGDQSHVGRAVVTSQSFARSALTGGGGKARKSRAKGGSGKKRTSFTLAQLSAMERRFEQQRYLTTVERREFAAALGLDDSHVKIWFQNRRSKRKKQGEVSSSTCSVNRPPHGTRPIAAAANQMPPGQPPHAVGSAPVSVGAAPFCTDQQHQPVSFREAGCPHPGTAMGHFQLASTSSQQRTNGVRSASVANFPPQCTRTYNESTTAGTVADSCCYTSYASTMNTSAAASAIAPFANYPHAYPPQMTDFSQSHLVSSAVISASMPSYSTPYPTVASSAAQANHAGYLYHHCSNPAGPGPEQRGSVNLAVHMTQQGVRSTSPFNFSFTPPGGSGCHAENSLPQPLPLPLLSSAQY